MLTILHAFALCFIPLFVAVDPLGALPLFVTVTAHLDARKRRRVALQALPTALAIGVVFFLVGGPLLHFLKIHPSDLEIAGGALLFAYAMLDLVMAGRPAFNEESSLGIVPLATPIIVGPAVLTMGLVLVDSYGKALAITALVANLVLLGALLLSVQTILRFIPINSMKAMSKVADLLLAAIGVGFIRQGIIAIIAHPQ
jgi:multiple antibiotic resistance protein